MWQIEMMTPNTQKKRLGRRLEAYCAAGGSFSLGPKRITAEIDALGAIGGTLVPSIKQVPSARQAQTFPSVPVVESFQQTDRVRQRSAGHEHVHDLVARAVDIKGPGVPLFGNAGGVDDGACRV